MATGILKNNIVRIGLIAAVAVTALLLVVGGPVGLYSLFRLHADVRAMHQELTRANTTIDSLATEVERLRSDTSYIERIARERLGMAKKNERVFKFVGGK